ncbi:hypothetical protein [Chitinophaga skermanii]|uniref:hypothetical protein n=1 Tax=Chitinophaga skermanii TaxID=331697 RepID=UPI0011E5A4CC|nr:hypothetical protein [Chitinophaga skermanii]
MTDEKDPNKITGVKWGASADLPIPGISPGIGVDLHLEYATSEYQWIGNSIDALKDVLNKSVPISPEQVNEFIKQATVLRADLMQMRDEMKKKENAALLTEKEVTSKTPPQAAKPATKPESPKVPNGKQPAEAKPKVNNTRKQSQELLPRFSTL